MTAENTCMPIHAIDLFCGAGGLTRGLLDAGVFARCQFRRFSRLAHISRLLVADQYFVFGPDYGLPQLRKRMIFFASLHGKISIPAPTHATGEYVTLFDAIGGLEAIKAGEALKSDRLHRSPALSLRNMKRIRVAMPGGTWRDWPSGLRLECHKRSSGATYPSVYGRMEWDKPAPTITTQFFGFGNGRFGHPNQNRAISLREGAILQAFPADYQFVPSNAKISFGRVGRMIGNAVPVTLGRLVGTAIRGHLQEVDNGKG